MIIYHCVTNNKNSRLLFYDWQINPNSLIRNIYSPFDEVITLSTVISPLMFIGKTLLFKISFYQSIKIYFIFLGFFIVFLIANLILKKILKIKIIELSFFIPVLILVVIVIFLLLMDYYKNIYISSKLNVLYEILSFLEDNNKNSNDKYKLIKIINILFEYCDKIKLSNSEIITLLSDKNAFLIFLIKNNKIMKLNNTQNDFINSFLSIKSHKKIYINISW